MLWLIACATEGPTYSGYDLVDHFPLDGERRWDYASNDTSVTHRLDVVLSDAVVERDGVRIHELSHLSSESGDQLLAVQWSSDTASGVLVHGYDDEQGPVSFDDPVVFAEPRMVPGDSVSSGDFTSTFVGVEACPNHWTGEDWDSCLHMSLDGDAPFAGDYWLVPRYGTAWLELRDDTDTWVLVEAEWAPE